MANSFSGRSATNLSEAHPDLQRLFNEVLKIADCTILCGYRGEWAQNDAYRSGRSKVQWPNSKHNMKPSLAVDVAPYPINFSDIERFKSFAEVVKMCAKQLGIAVEWGGDWAWKDYPHWQLKSDGKPPTSK